MRLFAVTVTMLFSTLLLGSAACAARTAVTPQEALNWTRYVVPLPKSIQVLGKIQVTCTQVAIALPASSDIKVSQGRKELRAALGLSETGADPASPAFTITLQLGGSEASELAALRNSDQAYKIFPEAGDTGLRLVARDPLGLYYAAKTLQLMLAPKVSGGNVQIPVVEVLDWPDMAERGLWGCDHFLWLRWMADRKMNIGEQISGRSVSADGTGHSSLKAGREPMVTEGPYYGVRPVPAVLHLEQVYGSGLFQYLLQVIGAGGQYGCICYSNGAFTHVLADWIVDLASLPHVTGVDVWMAENLHGQGGCQCSQCRLWDRNVLEANTIVAAWEEAKTRLGRYIDLYILTSEETYSTNTDVFNALPNDVRIWYYHSLYTYTSGRAPMIPTNVQNVANSGRYAGVCPSISAIGNTQPFQSAEFMRYRMNEFVDKNLSGLIGYATPPPLVSFVGYNVEAAAEYSWNAQGRSTHEFAASYAVRKGYPDPETFAEWADAIGRLEFDLYGSEWPTCEGRYFPGYVADCLKRGTLPSLGTTYPGFRGPWGEFKNAQQLDDAVVRAARAVSLARQMDIDEYYYESLYAEGLATSLRALYKLRSLVTNGTVSSANREMASYYFGVYVNGIRRSIDAVREWCIAVNGESGSVEPILAKLQHCIYGEAGTNNPGMLQVASACGCTPTLPYNAEPTVTVADAKRLGEGALVNLYGQIVTGSRGDTCFLQERDRLAGIRVRASAGIAVSSLAAILGRVESMDGELVINADILQPVGSAGPAPPLGMSMRNLGGRPFGDQPGVMEYAPELRPATGLNNIGLLVTVTGWVTSVGPDYFYLDDGSKCDDGSGQIGVRMVCADPAWTKPPVGEYVRIDGISSSYLERGHMWRALYITDPASIQIVSVPVELVLDEDDAEFTGEWPYATAPGGAYNDDYKRTTSTATETAIARWTPQIPRAGHYDVYVMYADGVDRAAAAVYTVCFAGGSQTYLVDQTTGGGAWQLLGRQFFSPGTAGYVQLGNATASTGATVVADAVRFVFAGAGGTPPSVTAQPASQNICAGANVSFSVTATGSSPLSYQWRRGTVDITDNGHLSGATTPTLSISNCSPSDAAPDYNCLVSNIYGSVPSANAGLIVGDTSLVASALPASNIDTDTITWNWTAAPGAIGYTLWTAQSGGTQIGGTINGTSYTQSGLDPGTAYTCYVEALTGCGPSISRTRLGPASTTPRYCVENGDFEGGFTGGIGNGWRKTPDDGTSTFARETSIKRDGTSSQMITDPVLNQAYTGWLYQKINVQPNRGYTYRVYNRREVTNGAVLQLGVNYTGGLDANAAWDGIDSAGEWRLKTGNFTSGATGLVTIMFRAGYNGRDSTVYVDGVYLLPQAPTVSGGSTTIAPGGSAVITASGGFGGSANELHWYTGPAGTGSHVGTGTSITVRPTVTTKYYPRWESAVCAESCRASDDGAPVTVTVAQ